MQTNNYQAILVTNNLDTFVIYIYMCGEMQWSSLGRNKAAVVGYNSEGNFFQNHPASGYDIVADIISCGIKQENRRKRQAPIMTNIPMNLPTDPVLRERARKCISSYNREVQFYLK